MEEPETDNTALVHSARTGTALAIPEASVREQLLIAWKLAQRSRNTIAAYERDVRDYFAYCDRLGIDVLTARRPTIDLYRHVLDSPDPTRKRAPRGYTQSTIARKLSALASFYKYAAAAESPWVTVNPVADVKRPDVADESTTRGLDLDEARALRAAAIACGGMDGILVRLILATALRVSEACNIDTGDLENESGYRVVTVTRKGRTRQRIPLPRDVAADLDAYLGARTGPVFLMRGQRITRQQAADSLARVAQVAGIGGRISPHSLRHAAATLMLDAGVSIRDVQKILGHKDPRTTNRYDRARLNVTDSPIHVLAAALIGNDQ